MTFDIPCGVIQAKVWGKVGGKPVLGLHGWLDNAGTFDKLAPMLPEDVHFVAIDLPGHGKSSHKPKGVTTYDWVVDIKRVITQLGWETFSMICHSMSGKYGILYAGTFPKDVESIILLDAFVGIPKESEAPDVLAGHIKSMLEETPPKRVYPEFDAVLAKRQQQGWGLDKMSAEILTVRGTKQVEGGFLFTMDNMIQLSEVNPLMMLCDPLDVTFENFISFLRRVSCNVLLILSSETATLFKFSTSSNRFRTFADCICGTLTYRKVPGNHYVHLNNPQVIVPLVNSFLLFPKSRNASSKL